MTRHPNPSTAMARVVADELKRHGVGRAVVCPGSRSTAITLALVEAGLDVLVGIDERSAGFRALGHSIAGQAPGVVVTTSGSAVANLLPAVVEADRAGVPLLLITADRPIEMVARRTNQTMDQRSVFSGFVRDRLDLGPAVAEPGAMAGWRLAAAGAVAAARGREGRPGPAQVNIAFAEPTVPVSDDGRSSAEPFEADLSHSGVTRVPDFPLAGVEPPLPSGMGTRSIVIAGQGDYDAEKLVAVAGDRGIPVLATAVSGARGMGTIDSYHHLLVDGVPARLDPETVIVAGRPGPSDRLVPLMPAGRTVIHVDRSGLFSDVSGTMTALVRDDPVRFVDETVPDQDQGWSATWLDAGVSVREALDVALDREARPSGPGVARSLNGVEWASLVVASSLPIRDVDAQLTRPGWVHSNRGVSGIDGFSSTALGIADCRGGVVALSGDLSFLHDSNAFLSERPRCVVFVVVDNGGGGLFDLLPQARHAPDYERLFVASPGRDILRLAEFHGLARREVGDLADLGPTVSDLLSGDGPSVVRVRVDREYDVDVRMRLDEAARTALDG